MSKANPKKATAAILPLPLEIQTGIVVRPLTLGMYAALERIGSPLVTGDEPKDALELIPSLYLITHDPREVFRGNVLDLALAWADTVPVTVMAEIRAAADRQIAAMIDVCPETEKKKFPRMTAGSPRGSSSVPPASAGPTKRSSGKSRPARSRS